MPHGGPDWGTEGPLAAAYIPQDIAELAARMGSIVTFDRRGNIIWLDNFEDNINKWYSLLTGAGAAIALSSDFARNGGLSGKLTTGDALNDMGGIGRYFGLVAPTSIGLEISFTPPAVGPAHFIHLGLAFYDGAHGHYGEIYLAPFGIPPAIYYYVEPDVYVLLQSIEIAYFEHAWSSVKLVIDIKNHKYVRAIVNSTAIDMSQIPYYYYDLVGAPYLQAEIWAVNGLAAASRSLYVDDAIITQNEPPNPIE